MRFRVLLAAIAGALLATLGVGAALAVTPNDVQYNGTTTTTATTTTAGSANTSTGTTTSGTTTSGTTTTDAQGVNGKFKPPAKASGGLTPTKTTGTLPFTGLNIGLALLAACFLLAGGFALRRFGRKSDGSTL
ncbi:MAG: hypothetical protein ABI990_00075 [Actinomycetota bacterium]